MQTCSTPCVVDCFWGSCAVFLPPPIELDLAQVCGYSGYVHSCGRNVFIRNFRKIQREHFELALDKYVEEQRQNGIRVQLVFYGHEDFTKKDRLQATSLRDGLDDVKVYVDKYYMGSETRSHALKRIQERFGDRVEIPGPDFYDPSPEAEWEAPNASVKTLWLVADHAIGPGPRQKSDKQYFICYEQNYLNRNPLHWFEENKPAWIEHTTLPHTLAGAMLNVTRPWWPKDNVVIADPFVGTGTTLFEAAKYSQTTCICSDGLEIVETIVGDNLYFFSLDHDSLKRTEHILNNLQEYGFRRPRQGPSREDDPVRAFQEDYDWAMEMLKELLPNPASSVLQITESAAKRFAGGRFSARLLLYIALRADRRHFAAIERGTEPWDKAFFFEAKELCNQIARLRALRAHSPVEKIDNIEIFKGMFSSRCVADVRVQKLVTVTNPSMPRVYVRRELVGKFNPKMQCDVIITDPPYGFNTDEDRRKLAEIYQTSIPLLISALKPEGQLIFAVPDWSHTGREVPFFVLKEMVIRQVLTASEQQNREVIVPAHSSPPRGGLSVRRISGIRKGFAKGDFTFPHSAAEWRDSERLTRSLKSAV